MPEELLVWIQQQPDEVLINLLNWIRSPDADLEFEAVVSRQAPAKQKRKGS